MKYRQQNIEDTENWQNFSSTQKKKDSNKIKTWNRRGYS